MANVAPPPAAHLSTAELKPDIKRVLRKQTRARAWRMRSFYGLLLMAFALLAVFKYAPIWGVSISFLNFNFYDGILGSAWNDFAHFRRLFRDPFFLRVFRNNIILSLLHLSITFPAPIVLALLLNEVRHLLFKRSIQTVTYFPHFLSWVVYGGIMVLFIGPGGAVPEGMEAIGLKVPALLVNPRYFRTILVITNIMKEFGWAAIVYLAAIASIDPSIYEAAMVDGANRLQQARYITLPGLRGVMGIVFILSMGNILEAGFEQVFVMYNPAVFSVGDILDTYIYRIGLVDGRFSLATAVGLFRSVIAAIMIVLANYILRRADQPTLW
jgi:putative aldouronate transport system permease protein